MQSIRALSRAVLVGIHDEGIGDVAINGALTALQDGHGLPCRRSFAMPPVAPCVCAAWSWLSGGLIAAGTRRNGV